MKIKEKDFLVNLPAFKMHIKDKENPINRVSEFAATSGVHLAVLYTWLGRVVGMTPEIEERIEIQSGGDELEEI